MNVTNVIFSFYFDIFCQNSFIYGILLFKLPNSVIQPWYVCSGEEYMTTPLLTLFLELWRRSVKKIDPFQYVLFPLTKKTVILFLKTNFYL